MSTQDIRWIQRFSQYRQALGQLREAVALARQRPLTPLEGLGLIHIFEITHELAWNTLKDILESRGARDLYGSRDATREASRQGLIANGEAWMEMIQSRNLTYQPFDQVTANRVISAIRDAYYAELEALHRKLETLRQEQEA
jgi:nucleotidyltransferase substrate binding protein (TIGR01987 family)